MRFASFMRPDGQPDFGALSYDGGEIRTLSEPGVRTLREALASWGVDGLRQRARAGGPGIPVEGVRWLPPIVDADKVLCVGLNYGTHVAETGRETPPHPSVFLRLARTFVGHDTPVVKPRVSDAFDYEAELAVVIGRRARYVAEADAMSVIAGFTCMAENSVRDFQKHAAQVTPGKNFERSGAIGPWLATIDQFEASRPLRVIGRLNGSVMQDDTTDHLIYPIERIIAYVSTFVTLEAGDVIATGTPAGVGMARKPPVFMKPGDVFEVEIPGVGLLRNPVVAEADDSASR